MTGEGRKTLTDKRFIETVKGERRETEIGSEDEFEMILEREFQIRRAASV
jgi:arylamine N-acetyltransferase